MHDLVLVLHSWMRWAAIVTGVLATATAFGSLSGAKKIAGLSSSPSRSTSSSSWHHPAAHAERLLGLRRDDARSDRTVLRSRTRDDHDRRHRAGAHRPVRARKAATPAAARTQSLIFYGLSTLLLLVGTPWPGMRDSRPLFRL
jgi:hypothetical protein